MSHERHNAICASYRAIADASMMMLTAARGAHWDELIAAERTCAQRIDQLKSLRAVLPLDAESERYRAEIIRTVLQHDAEIRDLTQPWMRQLELLLKAASDGRRVDDAYR